MNKVCAEVLCTVHTSAALLRYDSDQYLPGSTHGRDVPNDLGRATLALELAFGTLHLQVGVLIKSQVFRPRL